MGELRGREDNIMTCAEFQRVLPFIIEAGGNADEEGHLRECRKCSDLVQDLRYIAEQARLLLPMRDPGPAVWQGIQKSLEREGMLRPSGNMVRLRPENLKTSKWSWAALGTIAALLLVAFALVRSSDRGGSPASVPAPAIQAQNSAAPAGDQQVVRAVADRNPDLRDTYAKSLREVDDYIRTAQQTVQQYPDDPGAHEHLMQAYRQKAMLYDMALSRATQ